MGRKSDNVRAYGEVIVVNNKKRMRCIFCSHEMAEQANKLKWHLSGLPGHGVDICPTVPLDIQKSLVACLTRDRYKRAKIISNFSNSSENFSEVCKKNDDLVIESRVEDKLLVEFLVLNNIDIGVIESSSFNNFIDVVAKMEPPYKPPTYSSLMTEIIPGMLGETETRVKSVKESWGETGCTLISDIWRNEEENRCLVNVTACSQEGVVLLDSLQVPYDKFNREFFEDIICFCIRTIGPDNVVQYIDGTRGWGLNKASMVEEFPHIYFTKCVDTEIQSFFEEVLHEVEWAKVAFEKVRSLASRVYCHGGFLSLMRKYADCDVMELMQHPSAYFPSNYEMIRSIIAAKGELLQLVSSPEWPDLAEEEAEMIRSSDFWNQVEEIEKALRPLAKILRLVHSRYDSSSGYLYKAMEMATGVLRKIYDENPVRYQRLWEIFNSMKGRIDHPIHSAAAFLNPKYMDIFSEDKNRVREIKEFVVNCLGAINDRDALAEEIEMYSEGGMLEFEEDANESSKWWAQNSCNFPTLKKYATRILRQPCSTSACKRSLSAFQTAHVKKPRGFGFEASSSRLSWLNMILNHRFKAIDFKKICLPPPDVLLNMEEVPCFDPQQSSAIAGNKSMHLQFITKVASRLVTGEEVKSERGSSIHVFLVDTMTGNVVRDGEPLMLNLTVSALEGDFDEDLSDIWEQEDFTRNEIGKDILLMTGSLQLILKGGIGTLGSFCFNYGSKIARNGKFKLGLKVTYPDAFGGINIRDGVSNAFVVEDRQDTTALDGASSHIYTSEYTDFENQFYELGPLSRSDVSEQELVSRYMVSSVRGQWYEHNFKSRLAAMRWLKLRRIVKRAQKMCAKTRDQKRLEEWIKGQDIVIEKHRMLTLEEPRQGISLPEDYSKGESGSSRAEIEDPILSDPAHGKQLGLENPDDSTLGKLAASTKPGTSAGNVMKLNENEEAVEPFVQEGCPTLLLPGLESHFMKLKTSMLGRSDGQLTVISGPEGCGKTTLVQRLCHDEEIKGHFGDQIYFVEVSETYHVKDMVGRILLQMKHPNAEFHNDEDALNKLEQCLKGMVQKAQRGKDKSPILLILENVWPGSKALLEKLHCRNKCYFAVVTSRFELVGFDHSYHLPAPEYQHANARERTIGESETLAYDCFGLPELGNLEDVGIGSKSVILMICFGIIWIWKFFRQVY